jgi:diaminopropionate ammonia-lyase
MQIHLNASSLFNAPLLASDEASFGPSVVGDVRRHLAHVPYQRTALHSLPALAAALNVGGLLVKDESERSSLGSFKALGGTHAVIRLVLAEATRQLGYPVQPEQLHEPEVKSISDGLTFTCATDGNHGRAVAAGARIAGARSQVFVHSGVSASRIAAIAAEGASVTQTPGNYDDSIAAVNDAALKHGWQVVSDTSWPGYEDVPASVMQGYLVMVDEVIEQTREAGTPVTHVFLQAGVGGYAAAVAAFLYLKLGDEAPHVIVVEPQRASCLFESALSGYAKRIDSDAPTIMAMLECYEPSAIAWRILQRRSAAFMTIDEPAAVDAMTVLAKPRGGDPRIISGESGGVGLAGLMEAARSASGYAQLKLDSRSVVLVFNTEGATDKALYERLIAGEGLPV